MNSTRLALFALVVGLLAGIGAGFVLGSKPQRTVSAADTVVGRASDRVSVDRTVDVSSASNTLAQVSAQAPPSAAVATRSGAYDGAARSASKAALGRVAAEVSDSEHSSWTGTITGTVLDGDGNLLSDVIIVTANGEGRYASRSRGTSTNKVGRAYTGPTDIDSALDSRAKTLLKTRRERLMASTDTKGQFAFSNMRPGSHSFTAHHEGLVFKTQTVHTGESVRFIGQPVALFHLDIRLPDGSAPEAATILVGDQRRSTAYRWSPDEPVLRLKERAATMTVLAGNVVSTSWRKYTSDYSSEERTIDLERDGEGPHTIEVEARRVLRVTLEDVSGLEPRLKAWVKVIEAQRAEGGDLDKVFDNAKSLSRGDGVAYILSDLDAGAYVIGAGRGKGAPEVSTRIELGEGVTEEHLVLGELSMDRFLIVVCTGPGGQPLVDVTFRRMISSGGGRSSGGTTVISREPGTFWFAHTDLTNGKEWVDDTKLELTADARGYGTITSQISNGQKTLALGFQSSSELLVHVSGDLSPGFTVSAVVIKDDDDSDQNAFMFSSGRDGKRVNSEGEARLTGLQPGLMRVTLRKANGRNPGWPGESVATQEITIRAGSNEVTFVAPTFHDVMVYAPDLKKGDRLSLQKVGGELEMYFGAGNAELNASLRATFESMAAGEYTLNAQSGGSNSQMKITVPSGEVLFQPGIINAYEVGRVEAGKLGEKGGLQKGDVVVAINGKEFEGNGFYPRLQLDLNDGPVALSINRGGRAMTISIGPTDGADNWWAQVGVTWTATTR